MIKKIEIIKRFDDLFNDMKSEHCVKCDFHGKAEGEWNQNLQTSKHVNGYRSTRIAPHKCKECDFETKHTTNLKYHALNKHSNIETRRQVFTYYCDACNLGEFCSSAYQKHLKSNKHLSRTNDKDSK